MEPKSNALRQDRQLCNKSCGILLLYWLLMNGIVIATMLIRLGLALLTSGPPIFALPDQIEMLLTSELLVDGTGYILASLAGLVMVFLWKGDSLFRESFRYQRSMTGASLLQLLCVFMACQLCGSLLNTLIELLLRCFGLTASAAMEVASMMESSPTMLLYACLLAPISEEIIFRGAILRSFQPFGKRFAIVFSAVLFSLFHGNIAQIPFAFLAGLVLGYVAAEYSLTWSIVLHLFNNLVLSQLLGQMVVLQVLVLLGMGIAGAVILLARHRDISAYGRCLRPMPATAVRGMVTAPCFLLLILVCVLSTVLSISRV